jgi:hypothetical protein
MSQFYDLASLVVIPSGYKASTIYAQKPLTTDGQLSFSRASTATRVNASGLIEAVASNVPRLDYLGSSCPRLLLEPQRTNVITYSEDVTTWGQNQTPVVTLNNGTAPDGNTTADKVVVNAASEGFYNFSGGNVASGTTYTTSIFIKYISGATNLYFGFAGTGFGGDNLNSFNIQNGTVTSSAAGNTCSVVSYGNGWYRLIDTKTASATNTGGFILYGVGSPETQYYVWGAQLEAGAYATSYIPTLGASVTRLKDDCYKFGISSLIGQTEGTLFLDFDFVSGVNANYGIIYQAAFTTYIYINQQTSGSISGQIQGVGGFAFTVAKPTGRYKCALAYKSGDSAFFVNGVQVGTTNTTTFTPVAMDQISLAVSDETNTNNQALLFKTRLTNAQLAELTAL